ncbi:zinc-ribbon domain-containing protein [Roseomonas sp. WA12]
MRVACPECAAEYDLPPAFVARLGGGKTVRCARCGTTWAPPPPAEPAPPNPPPETPPPAAPSSSESALRFPNRPPTDMAPPPSAPEPPAAPAGERADTSRFLVLGWAASLLLLAGAAAAAWVWRIELVEAWPPAARAFLALGLAG